MILLAVAAGTLAALRQDQAATALQAFCAPVPASLAGYSNQLTAIRNRAWILASPSQPQGVAPLIAMPDARLGPPIRIHGPRLSQLLTGVARHTWIPQAQAWALLQGASADGTLNMATVRANGGSIVTLADLYAQLAKGLDDTTAAQAVIDLLSGEPTEGCGDLRSMLLQQAAGLELLELRSFQGRSGTQLVDTGRPPYRTEAVSYRGLLARCVGAGWPTSMRIVRLESGLP